MTPVTMNPNHSFSAMRPHLFALEPIGPIPGPNSDIKPGRSLKATSRAASVALDLNSSSSAILALVESHHRGPFCSIDGRDNEFRARLLQGFDAFEWLPEDDRVRFKTAFVAELSLRFADELKQVLCLLPSESAVTLYFDNLRAVRDNAVHHTRDYLAGQSLTSSLPSAANIDRALTRFRKHLAQHLRPIHIAYLTLHGVTLRRGTSPTPSAANVAQPVMVEAQALHDHVSQQLMSHKKLDKVVALPNTLPRDVQALHEKRRITAEVMREFKMQQLLQTRLAAASKSVKSVNGSGGEGAEVMGEAGEEPAAVGGNREARMGRRGKKGGQRSMSRANSMPQSPSRPNGGAIATGSTINRSASVVHKDPSLDFTIPSTDPEFTKTDDPLLMASFLRRPIRSHVPVSSAPQERYLYIPESRRAGSAARRITSQHAQLHGKELYRMIVDAERHLAPAGPSAHVRKSTTPQMLSASSLNATSSNEEEAYIINMSTDLAARLSLTGIGPPRMILREMHSRLASPHVLDLIHWVDDNEMRGRADHVKTEDLDDQIARAQEVEELFEEIMSSVSGSNHTLIEPPSLSKRYPGIPADSLAAQLVPGAERQMGRSSASLHSASTPVETHTIAHRIQMMPRHVSQHELHVAADEFARQRAVAMAKVPSSKEAAGGKYNYGGYIPQTTVRLRKNRLTWDAYREYVSKTPTNFIGPILVRGSGARPRSPGLLAAGLEPESEVEVSDEEVEVEDVQNVVSYVQGEWSVKALDAMSPQVERGPQFQEGEAIGGLVVHREEEEGETSVPGGGAGHTCDKSSKATSMAASPVLPPVNPLSLPAPFEPAHPIPAAAAVAVAVAATATTVPTFQIDGQPAPASAPGSRATSVNAAASALQSKPNTPVGFDPNAPDATDLDPSLLARRLDAVSTTLGMSPADKLHMAVVYGRQPLDVQFRVVCAWEAIAKAVVDRETVLGEWIRWEFEHGQPMRFWAETSVERLPESRARAEVLGRLERAGERVKEAVREMRRVKLRVVQQGRPLEKVDEEKEEEEEESGELGADRSDGDAADGAGDKEHDKAPAASVVVLGDKQPHELAAAADERGTAAALRAPRPGSASSSSSSSTSKRDRHKTVKHKRKQPEPQYASVDMPVMYRDQEYLAKMRVDQRKLLHSLVNPMEKRPQWMQGLLPDPALAADERQQEQQEDAVASPTRSWSRTRSRSRSKPRARGGSDG